MGRGGGNKSSAVPHGIFCVELNAGGDKAKRGGEREARRAAKAGPLGPQSSVWEEQCAWVQGGGKPSTEVGWRIPRGIYPRNPGGMSRVRSSVRRKQLSPRRSTKACASRGRAENRGNKTLNIIRKMMTTAAKSVNHWPHTTVPAVTSG